ncbi:MAG: glycosyltransferase [Deltaproteobacteria bacterium]
MNTPPPLTVIVPTKNRASTAVHAVRSALSVEGHGLDVIVQDCSDSSELADALRALDLSTSRLRYRRSPGAPSMTENWNLAFEGVSTEYVIVIGDDDAVSPLIGRAAEWAATHRFDAVLDKRSGYLWPGCPEPSQAGTLLLPRCTGRVATIDVNSELTRECRRLGPDMQRLPHVYNGIVRTDLMHKIRARAGVFFKSTSPDYFACLALSGVARECVAIDYPLTMAGGSPASNSGRAVRGEMKKHYDEYVSLDWPEELPSVVNVESSITEASMRGLQAGGRADLIPTLNFAGVFASCVMEHPARAPKLIKQMLHVARSQGRSGSQDLVRMAKEIGRLSFRRSRSALGDLPVGRTLARMNNAVSNRALHVEAARDISEALRLQCEILRPLTPLLPFGSNPHAPAARA